MLRLLLPLLLALLLQPARADTYYLLSHGQGGRSIPPSPVNPHLAAPKHEIEPGIWLVDDTAFVRGAQPSTPQGIADASLKIYHQVRQAREAQAEMLRTNPPPVTPPYGWDFAPPHPPEIKLQPGMKIVKYNGRTFQIVTNDDLNCYVDALLMERDYPGFSTNYSKKQLELPAFLKGRPLNPVPIIRTFTQPTNMKEGDVFYTPRYRPAAAPEPPPASKDAPAEAPAEAPPAALRSTELPGLPFNTNNTTGWEMKLYPLKAPTPYFFSTNWSSGDTNSVVETKYTIGVVALTKYVNTTNGPEAVVDYYTNFTTAIDLDIGDYKEFKLSITYPDAAAAEEDEWDAARLKFQATCVYYNNPPGTNLIRLPAQHVGANYDGFAYEPCDAPWPYGTLVGLTQKAPLWPGQHPVDYQSRIASQSRRTARPAEHLVRHGAHLALPHGIRERK